LIIAMPHDVEAPLRFTLLPVMPCHITHLRWLPASHIHCHRADAAATTFTLLPRH